MSGKNGNDINSSIKRPRMNETGEADEGWKFPTPDDHDRRRPERPTSQIPGLRTYDDTQHTPRGRGRAPIVPRNTPEASVSPNVTRGGQSGRRDENVPRPSDYVMRNGRIHERGRVVKISANFGTAARFKYVMEATSVQFPEAVFNFTPEGLLVVAMDTSHIAFIEFRYASEDFDSYDCDEDVELTLSLKNLHKVMNCANPSDELKLEYIEGSDAILFFIKDDDSGKTEEISFRLNENSADNNRSPEINFVAKCTMPSQEFSKLCSHLELFSDVVTIKAKDNRLQFCSDGPMGCNKITVRVELTITQNVLESYNISLLKQFSKASNVARTVELHAANDLPLMVKFPITLSSFLAFFLVPRVDTEGNRPETPDALQTQQPST